MCRHFILSDMSDISKLERACAVQYRGCLFSWPLRRALLFNFPLIQSIELCKQVTRCGVRPRPPQAGPRPRPAPGHSPAQSGPTLPSTVCVCVCVQRVSSYHCKIHLYIDGSSFLYFCSILLLYLSKCLPSVFLSINLSIYIINPVSFISLSVNLSIYLFIFLSIYLSIYNYLSIPQVEVAWAPRVELCGTTRTPSRRSRRRTSTSNSGSKTCSLSIHHCICPYKIQSFILLPVCS